jgi:dephospho-CoA kinase
MKVIGITGNIASGKSTVARMFEALGARIIDADEIARIVVEPGEPAWKEIAGEFGKDVLDPNGAINRKRLADIVFSDEAGRKRLNEITHPRIMEKIRGLVRGYEKEGAPVVMIKAALIVEKGAQGLDRHAYSRHGGRRDPDQRLMEGRAIRGKKLSRD